MVPFQARGCQMTVRRDGQSGVGRKSFAKCRTCDGTGKIPLFTSRGDCPDCFMAMGSGGCNTVLHSPKSKKPMLISDFIKTPEGLRKLAMVT